MTTYRVPVNELRRFEKSLGKDLRVVWGMPAIGAALGAVLVPVLVNRPPRCQADPAASSCSGELPYGVIGAFGGVVVGGLLGGWVAKERWVEIRLSRFALGPIGGRGVYFRVRF